MKNINMDNNLKPLVSFQGISDEEHKSIVNKMVEGGVAEKEVILRLDYCKIIFNLRYISNIFPILERWRITNTITLPLLIIFWPKV